MNMTLHNDGTVERDPGRRQAGIECPTGVAEDNLVVRVGLAQGHGQRARFSSAPGASGTLEVTGRMWGHIVH